MYRSGKIYIENALKEIKQIASILWKKGWAERNAGNISLLVDEDMGFSEFEEQASGKINISCPALAGKYIIISISGSRMRDLAKDPLNNLCLIKISADAKAYHLSYSGMFCSDGNPTSELSSHLAIYQKKIEENKPVKAIVHAHAREIIILSHKPEINNSDDFNKILWGSHPEAVVFLPDGAAFVPYKTPGSDEIATDTYNRIEGKSLAVWEGHGSLAFANTPMEAFDLIDIAAKASDIYLRCLSAGYEPKYLSEEEQQKLREL